jgi:NADH-quinone oxidoreductase subunit L
MMIGLGAGSYTAGLGHLFTHAVFKCMLFLCAGSVIHACHHLQDMNRMGGLRKKMPLTWLATLAGVLAISGVPLFSGFYSKDAILAASLARALDRGVLHWAPYVLGQITAVLTAYYMFRLFFWTFHGKPRDEHVHEHAHESPRTATVPLLILATGCLGFWWSGTLVGKTLPLPGLSVKAESVEVVSDGGKEKAVPTEEATGWVNAMIVSPVAKQPREIIKEAHGETHLIHHEHLHHQAHNWATGFSLAGLVLGLFAAWLLYYKRAIDPAALVRNHPGTIGRFYELAAQLWFFDRLYQDGIVPPVRGPVRVDHLVRGLHRADDPGGEDPVLRLCDFRSGSGGPAHPAHERRVAKPAGTGLRFEVRHV